MCSNEAIIMPPTSEEVEGAYWFGSVRPIQSSPVQSVCESVKCVNNA